jgi:hypothetical protein
MLVADPNLEAVPNVEGKRFAWAMAGYVSNAKRYDNIPKTTALPHKQIPCQEL